MAACVCGLTDPLRDLLRREMDGKHGEDAYAAYRDMVSSIGEQCYNGALNIVRESDASQDRKDHAENYIHRKYQNDVATYPPRQRQAILDGQVFGPITQNGAIAINALCDEMFNTANALK